MAMAQLDGLNENNVPAADAPPADMQGEVVNPIEGNMPQEGIENASVPQGITDDDVAGGEQINQGEPSQQSEPSQPAQEVQPPINAEFQALQAQVAEVMKQNQMLTQALQEQSEIMKQNTLNSTINPNMQQQVDEAQVSADEINDENIMDKFYENPRAVIDMLVDSKIGDIKSVTDEFKQQTEMAKSEKEWLNAVNVVSSNNDKFPMFEQLQPVISDIINKDPMLQGGNKTQNLIKAYYIAQGMQPPPKQIDIRQQLNDDGFLQKFIEENPDFTKKIAMIQAGKHKVSKCQTYPLLRGR